MKCTERNQEYYIAAPFMFYCLSLMHGSFEMFEYTEFFCYDPNNQIDSKQFEKILKYIKSGVENGATLETGGERLGSKGFYIQPTVFSNVQVYIMRNNIVTQI